MNLSRSSILLIALFPLLLSHCGWKPDANIGKRPATGNSSADTPNPYPAGTYEHFVADKSYPKTYDIYMDRELYEQTNPSNAHLILDTQTLRGILMNGERVVMDYPISSGRSNYESPLGRYAVLEKTMDKQSNKYGKIFDAEGKLINGDADLSVDKVPEGGRFEGSPMRCWLRFTWDGVGHHIGKVPRYRASHGCIRGYYKAMPLVYEKLALGSRVEIR